MKELKRLRKASNLTLKELAEKMNVTVNTIYHYESGKREPSLRLLKQLAAFFNVTVDQLIKDIN